MVTIPLCDLHTQFESIEQEITEAIQAVLRAGRFILGPRVAELETQVAEYCGARYAIGVGNGTDALYLALRSLGIGPGDEVITTPFTFIASSEAIAAVGAKPVFADIDKSTFNIDPASIAEAITPRTKAIMPVHLYGQPCDMDAIRGLAEGRGIHLVEDCAQSFGATYCGRQTGTLGTAGCFSFFPSKNLGGYGDGGMIVTDDPEVADQARCLRSHGGRVKYHHTQVGVNSRLDEIQAAILLVKLRYIDRWNQQRREAAYRYNRLLQSIPEIRTPQERSGERVAAWTSTQDAQQASSTCVYHQYTIRLPDRDRVAKSLAEQGVATAVYYPLPLHCQPVHAELGYATGSFPVAEQAAKECLSLPMFPELTSQQQERVVAALTAARVPSGVAA